MLLRIVGPISELLGITKAFSSFNVSCRQQQNSVYLSRYYTQFWQHLFSFRAEGFVVAATRCFLHSQTKRGSDL
jgi:hypothetical protein